MMRTRSSSAAGCRAAARSLAAAVRVTPWPTRGGDHAAAVRAPRVARTHPTTIGRGCQHGRRPAARGRAAAHPSTSCGTWDRRPSLSPSRFRSAAATEGARRRRLGHQPEGAQEPWPATPVSGSGPLSWRQRNGQSCHGRRMPNGHRLRLNSRRCRGIGEDPGGRPQRRHGAPRLQRGPGGQDAWPMLGRLSTQQP